MTAKLRRTLSDVAQQENGRDGFVPRSPSLRVDPEGFTLSFRASEAPQGKDDWVVFELGEARIPPTPLWGRASKFRDHPVYFWLIAAAIDSYLLRQRESKSRHLIAIDCVNTLVKIIEYALIQGFYKLQDVPKETWTKFAFDLSRGGWVRALEVERRAIDEISLAGDPATLTSTNNKRKGSWNISTSFLASIGTNIASVELNQIRQILTQALASKEVAKSGELSNYKLSAAKHLKQSMLTQYLRPLNLLADIQEPWGLTFVPIPNLMSFVKKHGQPNGRTQNFDPSSLAHLLKHAYKWVVDYGPSTIEFLRALLVQLSDLFGPTAREDYHYQDKPDHVWRQFQWKYSNQLLQTLREREELELLIGQKIYTWNKTRTEKGSISVNRILDELYSSCFCILTVMNARRKDEISHSAIGMYRTGLRQVDAELKLFEFDFYVEKTYRAYIPFYINDITRTTIELLDSVSELALGWAQLNDSTLELSGKEDKLFNYPNITHARGGGLMWYAFNSTRQDGKAFGFVSRALEPIGRKMRVAPHMFRRAYGTIFIYRYENADLVALAQQYGHFDVKTTLTYVTDGSTTPVGRSLAAIWSAPGEVVGKARKEHADSLTAEIQEAGIERIRALVDDVVVNGVRYGGGFTRLISRFHAKLGSRLDYSRLSKKSQANVLSNTILSRGHLTEPLQHATCMAGDMRRGAACSDLAGRPQRHIASAETCGGCPYSLIAHGHLAALKEDEARLSREPISSKATIKSIQNQITLKSLQRVIAMQSKRLGLA